MVATAGVDFVLVLIFQCRIVAATEYVDRASPRNSSRCFSQTNSRTTSSVSRSSAQDLALLPPWAERGRPCPVELDVHANPMPIAVEELVRIK